MPLLQVDGLNKYYGATAILENISLVVQPGEKIGLVGRNGCGKTTLIKILTGQEDYDGGSIQWSQGVKIGFLEQEPSFCNEGTVYQELRSLFKELDACQNRLLELQENLSRPGLSEAELNYYVAEYHLRNEEFEQAGGYQIEGRIQGVLRGLGFPKERWSDAAQVLSGGERTRLALARLLLYPYDILFLDEPTNYLDLEAIEWLEDFLQEFRGAVILISHDRLFLDKVTGFICELEFRKLKRYKGNYSSYRSQADAAYAAAVSAFEKQRKEVDRLEKFVRESRATEKSKRKAHSIEKRLSKIEPFFRPQRNEKAMKLNFREAVPSGRMVLEIADLAKSYDAKLLFSQANLVIESGEKVALIGPNGAGKTTLLKMILGAEQPDTGWVRFGYEVYPGYFSQIDNLAELGGTPFSQIMAAADLDNTEARTILGRFLFSGDDVFKNVADLSGGERRRLGLIKLMLSKANFLILDEPTNHLDLASLEVMEQALCDYDGTILIVSHDRYFLGQIVDRYLAIVDGQIQSFDTYSDYLIWRRSVLETATLAKPKSAAQIKREQSKELQRDLRRKQRRLSELEQDIADKESARQEALTALDDPANSADYQKSWALSQKIETVDDELNELYRQWEELQMEFEE